MTAHTGPMPVPGRITLALDAIGAEGPWVDEALGGAEPMVDQWEAGELVPTRAQIEALAEMTGMTPEYFYEPPTEAETRGSRIFMCQRNRRPENALTVIESRINWDGVLEVDEIVSPRSPYRPRVASSVRPVPKTGPAGRQVMPARTTSARQGRGVPHVPRDDGSGSCTTCLKPLTTWRNGKQVPAANPNHVEDVADIPHALPGPQDLAAGDREDH